MNTINVEFELDPITEIRLKRLQDSLGISLEEIINNAVQYYLLLWFCSLSNNQMKFLIIKDNYFSKYK